VPAAERGLACCGRRWPGPPRGEEHAEPGGLVHVWTEHGPLGVQMKPRRMQGGRAAAGVEVTGVTWRELPSWMRPGLVVLKVNGGDCSEATMEEVVSRVQQGRPLRIEFGLPTPAPQGSAESNLLEDDAAAYRDEPAEASVLALCGGARYGASRPVSVMPDAAPKRADWGADEGVYIPKGSHSNRSRYHKQDPGDRIQDGSYHLELHSRPLCGPPLPPPPAPAALPLAGEQSRSCGGPLLCGGRDLIQDFRLHPEQADHDSGPPPIPRA